MKRFLGLAVVVLLGSIPAHAQRTASSNANAALTGGGGGMGGAVSSGGGHLPIYTRATFDSVAFKGDPSFSPSSFLRFEDAVKEGLAESAPAKSVAQAAADNQAASRAKSRVEFVQDHRGNVIPVER
jgi:hypothetical protein